jgi:methanogenic corrinoid protein MtbC1
MQDHSSPISSFEIETFVDFLLTGERQKSIDYINTHWQYSPDFVKIYEEIIKKSLYRIGELWELNKISVASEHLATSIADSLLNHIYENVPSKNSIGKKIIIANTENEVHHVGIKMVADVFESYGWETFFHTGDVSIIDLIAFINSKDPNLLALSLSIRTNLPSFKKSLLQIRDAFSDLSILIGGQAFSKGSNDFLKEINNLIYIPDLYALNKFIKIQMNI